MLWYLHCVKCQENTDILVSIFLFTLRENCPNAEFFSGPYFPAFGLNTKIYSLNRRIRFKCTKYGPEKTPYLDTFHALLTGIYRTGNLVESKE